MEIKTVKRSQSVRFPLLPVGQYFIMDGFAGQVLCKLNDRKDNNNTLNLVNGLTLYISHSTGCTPVTIKFIEIEV